MKEKKGSIVPLKDGDRRSRPPSTLRYISMRISSNNNKKPFVMPTEVACIEGTMPSLITALRRSISS